MDFNIINGLIMVSEKAANIARICRQDNHLLSFLVQEKKEGEKNPRFVHDFKTFADVLVQEVVKHDLGEKFPALSGFIYGEESNEFTCAEETVFVEVKKTQSETEDLIFKILKNRMAANVLANEVHREIPVNNIQYGDFLLPENIGIWIDPIDATAEYISGAFTVQKKLYSGLPCVTVLIGVFDRDTGSPIAGVVNQPFYKKIEETWTGRYVYGLSLEAYKFSGPETFPVASEKVVAVSSNESDDVKRVFRGNGFTVVELSGAGYKLLSIITGDICGYVLSKPTTFFWDTCACQAILNSMGGGIIDFTTLKPLNYKEGNSIKDCCNSGGIVAYRNLAAKEEIVNLLSTIRG